MSELWKLQAKRVQIATQYLKRFEDAGIDAILSPTTPFSSVEHTKFGWVGYTGVYNIVDFSATSFPCGVYADQEVDKLIEGEQNLSEYDEATRKACKYTFRSVISAECYADP